MKDDAVIHSVPDHSGLFDVISMEEHPLSDIAISNSTDIAYLLRIHILRDLFEKSIASECEKYLAIKKTPVYAELIIWGDEREVKSEAEKIMKGNWQLQKSGDYTPIYTWDHDHLFEIYKGHFFPREMKLRNLELLEVKVSDKISGEYETHVEGLITFMNKASR